MAKKARRQSPAKRAVSRNSKKKTKKKSADDQVPTFDDGVLQFRVGGGKSDGKLFSVGLLDAQVTADELHLKHRLKDRDGKPSREFLVELAEEFTKLVDGLKFTPSLAYWVWLAVDERMAELQKKTN